MLSATRDLKRPGNWRHLGEQYEHAADCSPDNLTRVWCRASRGGGGTIRDRYNPDTEQQQPAQSRSQTFTKAPKMRAKAGDNWMKNSSQEKAEAARVAREREMEALMVARSHAIEEEEIERAQEEAERRWVQSVVSSTI